MESAIQNTIQDTIQNHNPESWIEANRRITEWQQNGDETETLELQELQLTELPDLPHNLQILDCSDNQLTRLPDLPSNLRELLCMGNKLTSLPELPHTLRVLDCNYNKLSSLPDLPQLTNLQQLYCLHNPDLFITPDQLTVLDRIWRPRDIEYIKKQNTAITRIRQWQQQGDTNIALDLSRLNLTLLPTLPHNLLKLNCVYNQLTSLPNLPDHLGVLTCIKNNLTSLPTLPSNLIGLGCDYNKLTSLPDLPNRLKVLSFSNNQLTSLPDISHLRYLESLYIKNNPDLKLTSKQINFILDNDIQIDITPDQLRSLNKNNQEPIPEELKLETTYDINILNCNNTNHFDGDDLAFVNKILVLLTPSNYILYCFQRDELFDALTHSDPVFVWRDDKINRPDWVGQPDRTQRVYKEPYSGLWLTNDSLIYLEIYNVLVLSPMYPVRLGTGESNWVSRMHGTDADIHMLYTLYPVNYKLISDKSRITHGDIKRFIPTRDDIDIIYNPDEQLVVTDNTITSSINGLTIEWNQNTRTDKVKDQTLVFNRI